MPIVPRGKTQDPPDVKTTQGKGITITRKQFLVAFAAFTAFFAMGVRAGQALVKEKETTDSKPEKPSPNFFFKTDGVLTPLKKNALLDATGKSAQGTYQLIPEIRSNQKEPIKITITDKLQIETIIQTIKRKMKEVEK